MPVLQLIERIYIQNWEIISKEGDACPLSMLCCRATTQVGKVMAGRSHGPVSDLYGGSVVRASVPQ